MRYRLRTLLIVLSVLPPLLALGWWGWGKWREEQRADEARQLERLLFGPHLGRDRRGSTY